MTHTLAIVALIPLRFKTLSSDIESGRSSTRLHVPFPILCPRSRRRVSASLHVPVCYTCHYAMAVGLGSLPVGRRRLLVRLPSVSEAVNPRGRRGGPRSGRSQTVGERARPRGG